MTKAAVAEVSRVSKNTAEHARKKNTVSANARKSASEEREKRKKPSPPNPCFARYKLSTTYRKTVLENAMVTMSGKEDLWSG